MTLNQASKFILIMFLGILTTRNLESTISSISPWSFQERRPTEQGKFDHKVDFLSGIDGISPSGFAGDSDFVQFSYQLTYGIRDKVEIGTRWGMTGLFRDKDSNHFGVSDWAIAARYRFFEPDRLRRSAGLDVEAGFSLPTGSFNKGLGTGGLGILFGWGLILPLDPVLAHFGMGFRLNMGNSDDVKVGGIFSYSAGLSHPMRRYRDQLVITGELKGFNHASSKRDGKKIGSAPDELYLAPGAIWRFNDQYRFSGSFLIGLTGESSDIGFNLEMQF